MEIEKFIEFIQKLQKKLAKHLKEQVIKWYEERDLYIDICLIDCLKQIENQEFEVTITEDTDEDIKIKE